MEFAANIKMHHATRTKATKLAATLKAEYAALELVAVEGEDVDHELYTNDLCHFEVQANGEAIWEGEGKELPELADLLDACQEQGIDPNGEGDDEPELGGSVVPETYRAKYREVSSNGQTCGDWLAERMVDDTSGADGKLNVEDLIALFETNGLDMKAKWAMARINGSRGWQGRFRMSGRLVLEKVVVQRGTYFDPQGVEITPPADWLEVMTTKHATWLAKEAKKAAAAQAAIKSAVEG